MGYGIIQQLFDICMYLWYILRFVSYVVTCFTCFESTTLQRWVHAPPIPPMSSSSKPKTPKGLFPPKKAWHKNRSFITVNWINAYHDISCLSVYPCLVSTWPMMSRASQDLIGLEDFISFRKGNTSSLRLQIHWIQDNIEECHNNDESTSTFIRRMQMFHEILKIWVPNMEQHYTKNTWEIPSNEATQRNEGRSLLVHLLDLLGCRLCRTSGPQIWNSKVARDGCFRKIVSVFPQIIHFNRGFHLFFHHPFWGIPIFGNTQILRKVGQQRACVQVAGRSFSSCLSRAALRKLRWFSVRVKSCEFKVCSKTKFVVSVRGEEEVNVDSWLDTPQIDWWSCPTKGVRVAFQFVYMCFRMWF